MDAHDRRLTATTRQVITSAEKLDGMGERAFEAARQAFADDDAVQERKLRLSAYICFALAKWGDAALQERFLAEELDGADCVEILNLRRRYRRMVLSFREDRELVEQEAQDDLTRVRRPLVAHALGTGRREHRSTSRRSTTTARDDGSGSGDPPSPARRGLSQYRSWVVA